jgi:hypothetical protein
MPPGSDSEPLGDRDGQTPFALRFRNETNLHSMDVSPSAVPPIAAYLTGEQATPNAISITYMPVVWLLVTPTHPRRCEPSEVVK